MRTLDFPVGGGVVVKVPSLVEDNGPPPGVSYKEGMGDVQLPVPQHCSYCGTHSKRDGANRCSNCGAPRPASARIKEIDVTGLNHRQIDVVLTGIENELARRCL